MRNAWMATVAVGWMGITGCSSSNNAGAVTVTMDEHYTFSPGNVTVPAGGKIVFMNTADFTHNATSEAASGSFQSGMAPGGFQFDTGDIGGGSSATVDVPAGLASGTVQPYFCAIHTSGMSPANPTITIQ